jgi:hypothetical protein
MRRFVSAAALVLAASAPASAQENGGLGSLLLRFFSTSNTVVLQQAAEPFNHAAHFSTQTNAQETMRLINRGIAAQISTFPLGSSSAGFTYTFDPALGVFNRSTESFGPVFAERPVTAGKGKFSFGVSYLGATYDRFEGLDLGGDEINLYLVHQDVNRDTSNLNPWFEGDLIRAGLNLDLTNDTSVLYANYGVSDRVDVGVAIPYQRLDMTATISTEIERVSTGADPFVVHQYEGGGSTHVFTDAGEADGIGDIVLRGKWNFLRGTSASMAAAVDLRLPTGKEEDLLGSGATQVKTYLIAAYPGKRFSPRASAGFTYSSGGSDFTGDLPHEVSYSAGFDAALHRRVTFTADFLGRTLLDAERVRVEPKDFQFVLRTDPTPRTTTRDTIFSRTGSLNVLLGSAGVKVNPAGRLLLVGNVLFALGESGLQDEITPTFGLEYSF